MEVDRNEPDIESAFQRFAATRVSAVIIIPSATLFLKQKLIVDLALKNRLPTMFQDLSSRQAA